MTWHWPRRRPQWLPGVHWTHSLTLRGQLPGPKSVHFFKQKMDRFCMKHQGGFGKKRLFFCLASCFGILVYIFCVQRVDFPKKKPPKSWESSPHLQCWRLPFWSHQAPYVPWTLPLLPPVGSPSFLHLQASDASKEARWSPWWIETRARAVGVLELQCSRGSKWNNFHRNWSCGRSASRKPGNTDSNHRENGGW